MAQFGNSSIDCTLWRDGAGVCEEWQKTRYFFETLDCDFLQN